MTKLILIFALLIPFLTSSSVLDKNGNELQSKTQYYIVPLGQNPNGGGGLALSVKDNRNPCPPNVMQETYNTSRGHPLELFSSDTTSQKIETSSDVNIVSVEATICVQRTVSSLGDVDLATGRRYVRSGGVLGRPGRATLRNWFKFEKVEGVNYNGGNNYYYYKIVYCPKVCYGGCVVECGDIGVLVENGRRWLGFGGEPLIVGFEKV